MTIADPKSIEAICAQCGDQVWVPAEEDPNDTLCVPCADDRDAGDEEGPPLDLNFEGDPTRNGAFG